MTATGARIGYGTVLELALKSAPTVFTQIKEVFDSAPPSDSDDNVDASHYLSPGKRREFIPGLTDSGEASFDMNYVPGSATDIFLRSIRGKALLARYTFANGVQIIFDCARQGYETAIPNDDKMTATLTLKVSGEPYLSAAAAPRNLVAPSISGTAQVGQVLTVDAGQWAGATDLTFQWTANSAPVSGATGETYIPVTADIGDPVLCTVTATNSSAFTTAVASAGTSNVIAA